ncbi:hypothetical protein A0J48_009435 [Sphaerospermopsis aphanizomenoides BCCUSP55]|uniref:hypothetical protein n=1 Tax=Sphaerospermopsis aphanizomenoides TaxID=459663 RepID=UPI000B24EBE3|nr:hypothetical protein [Sphaerospermopsis aphanizomenoides]MBK1987756.1 hypothetical protein [Sphaerospermopsis aphanizomenoides BCCUSP55]
MQKLIPTISLILSCISLVSCSNSPNSTTQETSTNTVAQSQPQTSPESEGKTEIPVQTESTSQTVSNTRKKNQTTRKKLPKQPQIGTVKELVNGDLLCYVTLVDEKGKESQVGASFEICAEESKFLNKKVRAVYTIESVNDCQSAEPCGKTRQESIITKMEVVDEKTSSKPENSKSASVIVGNEIVSGEIAKEQTPSANNKTQTISNGEWTITTGNHDSWTGVNNTGDISYKGCDAKGKCIELSGGKVSCRDGRCVTGWTNGDFNYILEQPITEDGNADSTLIVRKGETEILKATGLKAVPNN